MHLKQRSYQKELLDEDDIPFEDIKQNLKELNTINTMLGGHRITLRGITALLPTNPQKLISILEIGCGGGDNLAYLQKKLAGRNIQFTGVDLKDTCIAYAKETYPSIEFVHSDYKLYQPNVKPDIIFSSLFCHHFTEAQLIEQFQWMQQNGSIGFVINDLHRHPLAYYSIKLLTKFFSKSYLVKNDAPLSVARGFKKIELDNIVRSAQIGHISIKWKWAFRYLLIAR